jgi:hypothetical protein
MVLSSHWAAVFVENQLKIGIFKRSSCRYSYVLHIYTHISMSSVEASHTGVAYADPLMADNRMKAWPVNLASRCRVQLSNVS